MYKSEKNITLRKILTNTVAIDRFIFVVDEKGSSQM